MGHVIKALLNDYPTIEEFSKCSFNLCIKTSKCQLMFLTYQTGHNENLSGLQNFIKERTSVQYLKCSENCDGIKTVHSKIMLYIIIVAVVRSMCIVVSKIYLLSLHIKRGVLRSMLCAVCNDEIFDNDDIKCSKFIEYFHFA